MSGPARGRQVNSPSREAGFADFACIAFLDQSE
jgi:hypothetical protein